MAHDGRDPERSGDAKHEAGVERIVRSGFVRSVSNPTETEVVRMG
jgi:hypothetical protein